MAVSNEPRLDEGGDSGVAIRGGAIRVAGYASGVLVSLASAAILVRHLGIPGFGQYVTVTSLIALVGGVTEAGIIVYGIREYVATGEDARRHLLANLLSMRLALTFVGIACAICFGLLAGYREAIVLGTVVAGAGLLIQVVVDVLSISLQARLRLTRVTLVELSRRVLALALIAALALAGAGLVPLVAASTLATAFALGLVSRLVRSDIAIRLSFDRKLWRRLFSETLPYAIALSIAAIYLYVTVIMMSLIATEHETGLFGTSFRVTQVILAVPSLLLTAIFPLMSRVRPEAAAGLGDTTSRVFTVAAICGTWLSLTVALGAGFIIRLIAGAEGHGAIPVLRIQALLFVVSFISTSSALGLVALRRYRPLIISSSAALALNVLLAVALIPPMGARGGALADVLAEVMPAIGLTTTLVATAPEHRIDWSFLPALALACTAAATVVLLPIGDLAHAVAASIIYFTTLLLMGAIPQEVIGAARRVRLRSVGSRRREAQE
jgi:O-antigen/teichoic acid export membrane protein